MEWRRGGLGAGARVIVALVALVALHISSVVDGEFQHKLEGVSRAPAFRAVPNKFVPGVINQR